MRTPAHGNGKLRVGGTNKGGPGRPPKTFATFMRDLRQKPEVHDAIERAATDEKSRGFAPVLKTITEYDEDKPKDGKNWSGELVIRVVRDEVATPLPVTSAEKSATARIAIARDSE